MGDPGLWSVTTIPSQNGLCACRGTTDLHPFHATHADAFSVFVFGSKMVTPGMLARHLTSPEA